MAGISDDFWKDGDWGRTDDLDLKPSAHFERTRRDGHETKSDTSVFNTNPNSEKLKKGDIWHALPGEVSERMWGRGNVTPADAYMTDRLVGPLGITKDMSVLDLSAGLGSRLRTVTEKFGVYITGLEPDPEIARRGMALSVFKGKAKHAAIEHYDPLTLSTTRKYDCVIARETIYRVADKPQFVKAIVACCKSRAQFSFTDYIVNPENMEAPSIKAWLKIEHGAAPVGLVEMAELWAKVGVNLRTHDDLTEFYKEEVKAGMTRFAEFIASGIKPDEETKATIAKRIHVWAHRMAAIDQGMKFYRFYGMI